MDPDGYLRRFIDLAYSLSPPSPEKYAETLYRRFGLEECFTRDREFARILVTGFSQYARAFGLSLRTQEQCFTEINIVLRTAPNFHNLPAVVCFLVTLRASRPAIFRELREKRVDVDTVLNWLTNLEDLWYRQWAEATLIMAFLDDESKTKRLQVLNQQKESGQGASKGHAEKVQGLIGALCRD